MFGKNDKTKFAKKNRDTLLPSKTALLLNDIVAVLIFAVAFIIAIALLTYNPNDNCWFKTANSPIVYNKLGVVGAYVSDLLLSVFGLSAWWLIIGLFYLGYRKIIRNKIETGDWYTIFQMVSFIVLILSSTVFEYSNFSSIQSNYLHNEFGGMLGHYSHLILSRYLGQLGTGIITIILVVACFSFAFSISLVYIAEKVGAVMDFVFTAFMKLLSPKAEKLDDLEEATVEVNTPRKIKAKKVEEEVLQPSDAGFDALFAKLDANDDTVDSNTSIENIKKQPKTTILERLKRNYKDDPDITPIVTDDAEIDGANVCDDFAQEDNNNNNMSATHKSSNLFTNVKKGELPSTDLLTLPKKQADSISGETLEYVSNSIENKLLEFGVEAKITEALSGPVVTRYELLPSRGVRGEKIVGLGKEIARGLALSNVRIVETIPGKNTMGIEVPNFKRQIIYLKEIFDSVVYKHSTSKLTLALGKDIAGNVVVADLAKMPHLLVAGTTGSGKSVAVNAMILSILFQATPDEVKFIMIDPKMVELSFYQDIPHLLAPVITDSNYAVNSLKWTVGEMERRYKTMAKIGCKNIASFNQKIDEASYQGKSINNPLSITPDDPEPLEKWAYIVVIIDELSDLMMSSGKKVEQYIVRIAQKARAVGIHLIVATQRPSVDVITGLIKANIPSRISFQVTSKVDSRTILDQGGAETLLGQGDMLYLLPGSGYPQRVHGAFVNDDEVNKVVDFLKLSNGTADYVDEILTGDVSGVDLPGLEDNDNNVEKDSMFDESVKFIYETKRCSISALQTRFGIGYNRAARIMSHLETIGMVRRNERGGFELLKVE